MNNRIIINPQTIFNYHFRSIGTYKLLFYIFIYYDNEIGKVKLDKYEIADKTRMSPKTIVNSITELLACGVITKIDYYDNWYKLNKNKTYGK
jgi:hypothetical protein